MPEGQKWRVVSDGGGKGGIIVRAGQALGSAELSVRLAAGALVQELELSGGRLHYVLLDGAGPATGWVSLAVKGKDLVVREDVSAETSEIVLADLPETDNSATTYGSGDAMRSRRRQRRAEGTPIIQEADAADDRRTDMSDLSMGGSLGVGRFLFRAQSFWQELLPEHVTKKGLEFQLGLDTGKNLARLSDGQRCQPRVLSESDPEYLKAAVCLSNDEPPQADEAEVDKAVKAAASWGDKPRLRKLLISCHVPVRLCSTAFCEASARGHEDVVAELLRAKVPPGACESASRKTALHFACEQGHESVAKILLAAGADVAAIDTSGRTACELAREQDLGMMAKRLQKYAEAMSSSQS